MKIKKHKIKVLQDDQRSSFVVDLRAGKKEKIKDEKRSNFFSEKNKDKDSNNFLKTIKNKTKRKTFKIPFKLSKFRKTSFFPFIFFIFKVFRAIIFFFIDWIKDILFFLKKIFKLFFGHIKIKKRKKKIFNKKIKKKINQKKKIISKAKNIPLINFDIKKVYSTPSKKSIWYFILFLFLLIIPFKLFSYYKLVAENKTQDNLRNYSYEALTNLTEASLGFSQLNLSSAQEGFFQAGENFLLINQELNKIDEFVIFLASFSKNDTIKLASESKRIAKIGLYISSAGDNFSLAVDSLIKSLSNFNNLENKNSFSNFYFYSQKTEADIKQVNKNLKKIKVSSIPEEYRNQFIDIKKKAIVLEENFSNFLRVIPGLKDFLGVDSDKRYLIVFQNNAEIRATGGFIGSYAIVDLKKGKIENIEIPVGGSYDTEGGLKVLMEAPQPLHLVKPIWYFWDANWWPDWKMSAKNLMWFYEKSGGSSVDGVISITPDILGDVLKIVGPVDLTEKYGVIIDENNYWDIIQEVVEVIGQPEVYQDKNLKTNILDKVATNSLEKIVSTNTEEVKVASSTIESEESLFRNEPKKIIGDLMLEITNKFSKQFDKDLLIKSLKIIEKSLAQKNILLYFVNKDMQNEVETRSWAGRVKESPFDYLMVVNSNIAGGKTDKVLNNNYSLVSKINPDGSLVNKLTIFKKHKGKRGDLFYGVRNVNWLRVYVPLGSSLISVKGFSSPDKKYFKESEEFYEKNPILENAENKAEIDLSSGTKTYQEAGKTVFANWTMLEPEEDQTIEIEYQLPYNFYNDNFKNYSLLWQKQAGSGDINFDFEFLNKSNLKTIWTYPQNINSNNFIKFSENLESDRYLVIMFE